MKSNGEYRGFGSQVFQRGWLILFLLVFSTEVLDAQAHRDVSLSGDVTIQISNGSATAQPPPVTDGSTIMTYNNGHPVKLMKITVSVSSFQNNRYLLTAKAINVPAGAGTAQSLVNITNLAAAADFIRDIPNDGVNNTCNIRYIATATYADGCSIQNGGDTICQLTYTMVRQ
jgi:hypothetical protein